MGKQGRLILVEKDMRLLEVRGSKWQYKVVKSVICILLSWESRAKIRRRVKGQKRNITVRRPRDRRKSRANSNARMRCAPVTTRAIYFSMRKRVGELPRFFLRERKRMESWVFLFRMLQIVRTHFSLFIN